MSHDEHTLEACEGCDLPGCDGDCAAYRIATLKLCGGYGPGAGCDSGCEECQCTCRPGDGFVRRGSYLRARAGSCRACEIAKMEDDRERAERAEERAYYGW